MANFGVLSGVSTFNTFIAHIDFSFSINKSVNFVYYNAILKTV